MTQSTDPAIVTPLGRTRTMRARLMRAWLDRHDHVWRYDHSDRCWLHLARAWYRDDAGGRRTFQDLGRELGASAADVAAVRAAIRRRPLPPRNLVGHVGGRADEPHCDFDF